MFSKEMKARKTYTCDHCLRPIYKDVMGNDVQDGIRYEQWRLCSRDDCGTYPNEKWDW